MITREKAQILADTYNVKVLDVETLHDNKSGEYIADYIRLKIRDDLRSAFYIVYCISCWYFNHITSYFVRQKSALPRPLIF